MPEAARQRMQSALKAEEWGVPVCPWQNLSAQPGVAMVPKEAIPEVLERVGYTAHAVAMLI
eukprot:8226642-Lingulodinium_polyedra.AAC.1